MKLVKGLADSLTEIAPGSAVRERIIRAFPVEEQKILKKDLKIQKAKEKVASRSQVERAVKARCFFSNDHIASYG
ncbi:hypothetical protein LguiB_011776 [Lonicera macranthoides]